ncbi:MAG: hypothetical protein ACREGG_03780, partial [Candidatus Saccharimonadales bacterium]
MPTLYEYKDLLWEIHGRANSWWVIPFCPIHRMELSNYHDSFAGICDDCKKQYVWNDHIDSVAEYLRRKLSSQSYQSAEIVSIDGIQTPLLKTKVKLPEENEEYWIEGKLNESDKGRQLVIYVGEKNTPGKAQLFMNLDQEKLSFDHKDRKPEEIFSLITATFPSGKQVEIKAPGKK